MGDSYDEQLRAEAQSWLHPDTSVGEKLLRERIRHPKLIRDLMLDCLPTHRYGILEVGGGPLPVSDLLPHRMRTVIDPCTDEYRAIAPCPDHKRGTIERTPLGGWRYDLVICTNALDHVEDAHEAMRAMNTALRHGGYLAIMCAENNAITHPHPAHKINLTVEDIHRAYDSKYETVHQLTYAKDGYRYGWVPYDGRCGQPAFAILMRKALA